MFQSIEKTAYFPQSKPLMVYDGNCGFCKYWIIKWKKISGDQVDYISYQRVYHRFNDIAVNHFKEAVRLIDTDGTVYNGPDAAFMTFKLKGRAAYLHHWYSKYQWFKKLSNFLYQWIADNRNFLFNVSIRLFGKSARNPQPHWIKYVLGLLAVLLTLICVYLTNTSSL